MAETVEKQRWTVVIILLWLFLIRLFDPSVVNSAQYWDQKEKELYDNILNSTAILFYVSLPILILFADMKLGRLNIAIISSIVGAISSLVYLIFSGKGDSTIATAVLDPITLIARLYFEISLLCLGADQLVEMSSNSDELSSYVWWRSWCVNLGVMVTTVTSCQFKGQGHYNTYATVVHLAILIVIIITTFKIKRWILRYNYSVNPLKLYYGVLRFAIKNKYPLNRSAFTYWEENEPSRINLGKARYGGPFLDKDVESIKTFFRLLPMVFVITMINFPYQVLGRLSSEKLSFKQCLLSGTYFIGNSVIIIGVPIYRFIIRPYCFSSHRLSMLKKIGIGIALTVLGKFLYVALDLYISVPAYVSYNETICLLQSNETNHTLTDESTYMYLLIIPGCVSALGFLFITPGSFEFVFAQAPHNMRGLLIGLLFSIGGIYEIVGWMTIKPFKAVSEYLVPSCELYVLIMNFLFMVVCLVLFLMCSRKYILHSHENSSNVNRNYYSCKNYCKEDGKKNDSYGSTTSCVSTVEQY